MNKFKSFSSNKLIFCAKLIEFKLTIQRAYLKFKKNSKTQHFLIDEPFQNTHGCLSIFPSFSSLVAIKSNFLLFILLLFYHSFKYDSKIIILFMYIILYIFSLYFFSNFHSFGKNNVDTGAKNT